MLKVDIERLMSKTAPSQDCWRWMGSRTTDGYGRLKLRGKYVLAHRVFYTTVVGEIPEGLEIDHLCRNKICVNPEHLEPVTGAENQRRRYDRSPESIVRIAIPFKLLPLIQEILSEHAVKPLVRKGAGYAQS